MPTRNINLTEHFDQFVEEQVNCGRYKNASEVMRAGLRLLELQTQSDERKLAILRQLANEGFDELDQGLGTKLENDAELREFISTLGRKTKHK